MSREAPLPVFATLGFALGVIGRHFGDYLKAILVVQGAIVLVGVPFMGRLLDLGLAQSSVTSLTTVDLGRVLTNPFADLALLTIAIVATVLVYVELATLMSLARRHQAREPVTWRAIVSDVSSATAKLAHPSALLLIPYFFIVLPLGNIGLGSVLTQGIRLPPFISGELLKSDAGTWLYAGAVGLLLYLNLRLVFTIANFVSSELTVGGSMLASWRMSGWLPWGIGAMFAAVYALGAVLVAGSYTIALMPTRYADDAAPDAAPLFAGASLTLLQVAVFAVFGFAAAMIANVTVAAARRRQHRAGEVAWHPDRAPWRTGFERRPTRRWVKVTASITAVVLLLGASLVNLGLILSFARADSTLVLAHRGLISQAVENTIPALEAAAAVDPDYVELDIQETRDGELVVMHDADLSRLAGIRRGIGELTLAELREVTLRQGGFEAAIPTLDEFIVRALELDVDLLIELKPRGDESPEYLDNVIAAFERHDVTGRFLAHSLSKDAIEELEARAPQIVSGYIVPFNIGHAPETTVDFIVIEESSYSNALHEELRAEGLGLLVWTVNDTQAMRNYLRDNVEGIITDRPEVAAQQRAAIRADAGLLSRLEDAARRLFGF